MKLIIAFALFAVAFAVDEIQVVHLPEAPAPAFEQHEYIDYMRPLIIPQAFFESLMAQQVSQNEVFRVNFVDESVVPAVLAYDYSVAKETGDALADANTFKVNVVDAAVEEPQAPLVVAYQSSVAEESDGVEAYIADPESQKFHFMGSPVQDFQAPEAVADAESLKVNIVDSPVEEPQAPFVVAYQSSVAEESDGVEAYIADPESQKVQFVESPIPDFQAPEPIKLAEAALPESVVEYNFSEDHVGDEESTRVRFEDSPVEDSFGAVRIEPVMVKVSSLDAVKVVDAPRLGKLFADPRLR